MARKTIILELTVLCNEGELIHQSIKKIVTTNRAAPDRVNRECDRLIAKFPSGKWYEAKVIG
jgi:hypothetical protein